LPDVARIFSIFLLFFLPIRRSPTSILFPYTTLFRSVGDFQHDLFQPTLSQDLDGFQVDIEGVDVFLWSSSSVSNLDDLDSQVGWSLSPVLLQSVLAESWKVSQDGFQRLQHGSLDYPEGDAKR